MQSARVLLLRFLAFLLLPVSAHGLADKPVVYYTADLDHPELSAPYPGYREIREITRFVASLPGVCHHIQEIDLQSAWDAEVKTGRRPPSALGDSHADHGDKLYLHKQDRTWRLVRKIKWRYEGNGGVFTETADKA
jgi:hypothetical protein